MTASPDSARRVLALQPTTRGFGFVVLESLTTLVDWGVKTTRTDKDRKTLAKVSDLIDPYSPAVVIVEDCGCNTSRRSSRIAQLLTGIRSWAATKGLRTSAISKR